MKLVLALVIALSACGASPQQASAPPPALLTLCAPEGPLPPKAPPPDQRSAVNVGKWSIQVQLAREKTDRELRTCARRHAELVEWVRNAR